MPKGTVHFATTEPSVVSAHLTFSLDRTDRTWKDVVLNSCLLTGDQRCHLIEKALDKISSTGKGYHWVQLASVPDGSTHPAAGCSQLSEMVMGTHSTSLVNALGQLSGAHFQYTSRRSVLNLLNRLSDCNATLLESDQTADVPVDSWTMARVLNETRMVFAFKSHFA